MVKEIDWNAAYASSNPCTSKKIFYLILSVMFNILVKWPEVYFFLCALSYVRGKEIHIN